MGGAGRSHFCPNVPSQSSISAQTNEPDFFNIGDVYLFYYIPRVALTLRQDPLKSPSALILRSDFESPFTSSNSRRFDISISGQHHRAGPRLDGSVDVSRFFFVSLGVCFVLSLALSPRAQHPPPPARSERPPSPLLSSSPSLYPPIPIRLFLAPLPLPPGLLFRRRSFFSDVIRGLSPSLSLSLLSPLSVVLPIPLYPQPVHVVLVGRVSRSLRRGARSTKNAGMGGVVRISSGSFLVSLSFSSHSHTQ